MQKQQLFSIVSDFVLEIVNDAQHQHLSFLDNDDQCFAFVMDVLIPEVQLYVTSNHVCSRLNTSPSYYIPFPLGGNPLPDARQCLHI